MGKTNKYLGSGLTLTFLIVTSSCVKNDFKPLKLSTQNNQKLIKSGEWVSSKDSTSGISIRENKMAFFKNMEFTSEDIYEYQLIDSIYKFPDRKEKIGEYILAKDFKDTIYYQIIRKSLNSLTLKVNNHEEVFTLRKSNKSR